MPKELAIRPGRVLRDLEELARQTGGRAGAQRVAWSAEWRRARALLRGRLAEIGLACEEDEAGNLWARLNGSDPETIILGSHLDSVPNGGWLDGALGVFAGVEVLRTLAEGPSLPRLSVSLVDWADEEGARFGHSLFGSSAAAHTLDVEAVRGLRDATGTSLESAVAEHGLDIATLAGDNWSDLSDARCYLELHIEQGPVLQAEGFAVAAVSGTIGVERFVITFRGRAAHAGSTPMDSRADALLAAASAALGVERIAGTHGGRGTTGSLIVEPGTPTVVTAVAELSVDLRHQDRDELAAMRTAVEQIAEAVAGDRGCTSSSKQIWRAEPSNFDPALVETFRAASAEAGGRTTSIVSGALHDATQVSAVVPAAMLFCSSVGGISHSPDEDTEREHLETAIDVFGEVATGIALGERDF